MKQIIYLRIEAVIFFIFGLFHLHRIWAFVNPEKYSDFWLSILDNQGDGYYIIALILITASLALITLFVINIKNLSWWRWFYVMAAVYVLLDVSLQWLEFSFMNTLVKWMFTVDGLMWYLLWGVFVFLGGFSLCVSIFLWWKSKEINVLLSDSE